MAGRRFYTYARRFGGVLLAVGGLTLVVKTLPFYFWPFLLGVILIWTGWQLYVYDQPYW